MTVYLLCGTLRLMPHRPMALVLLALVIALLVCFSSIWLVPDGQGPFSAVHGPISHLKAWRDSVRVLSSIRLLLVVAFCVVPPVSFLVGRSLRISEFAPTVFDPPFLSNVLTC